MIFHFPQTYYDMRVASNATISSGRLYIVPHAVDHEALAARPSASSDRTIGSAVENYNGDSGVAIIVFYPDSGSSPRLTSSNGGRVISELLLAAT